MATRLLLPLTRHLLGLVLPSRCALCLDPLPSEPALLCSTCRTQLLTEPCGACPRCAATVGPYSYVKNGCSLCRGRPLRFQAALRLGSYEGSVKKVVLRCKHHRGAELAEKVGRLWAEQARDRFLAQSIDLVVPVPLHWWRRFGRGYNQAEQLARGLAGSLGLPLAPHALRRVRHTPMQTTQTDTGRSENVRGAFAARVGAGVENKTVLLVDDVMKTGSTADEAAGALRAAGASRVVVAVLARGH